MCLGVFVGRFDMSGLVLTGQAFRQWSWCKIHHGCWNIFKSNPIEIKLPGWHQAARYLPLNIHRRPSQGFKGCAATKLPPLEDLLGDCASHSRELPRSETSALKNEKIQYRWGAKTLKTLACFIFMFLPYELGEFHFMYIQTPFSSREPLKQPGHSDIFSGDVSLSRGQNCDSIILLTHKCRNGNNKGNCRSICPIQRFTWCEWRPITRWNSQTRPLSPHLHFPLGLQVAPHCPHETCSPGCFGVFTRSEPLILMRNLKRP